MTKLLHILFILLFALAPCVCLRAQFWDGSSCAQAIYVTADYTETITGPCTRWYHTMTWELPLALNFYPFDQSSNVKPRVYLDFTCVPDHYPTQELQDMFGTDGKDAYVTMPLNISLTKMMKNGQIVFSASIPVSYRDQMFQAGITEDVEAFIRVEFAEGGSLTMDPDYSFVNCMDNGNWRNIDDTLDVAANDEMSYYILPYSLWKNDSIRFVWTGDEPVVIWLGKDCNFLPDPTDEFFLDYIVIDPSEENFYKYTIAEIDAFLLNYANIVPDGLFYARIVSEEAGQFVIEKVPQTPAENNAIELRMGETVQVSDSNQVYFFPKTWTQAFKFVSPTNHVMQAYFANTGFYYLNTNDVGCMASWPFSPVSPDGHDLPVSVAQLTSLTDQTTGDYVYVRFVCNVATAITPVIWDNECAAADMTEIYPNTTVYLPVRSSNMYRMRVSDFTGSVLSIVWTGSSTNALYVADTCHFTASQTNKHVIQYRNMAANSTYRVTAANLNTWAARADADGYVYVLFSKPTSAGNVTFTTTKVDTDRDDPIVCPKPVSVPLETVHLCDTLLPYTWHLRVYDATGVYYDTAYITLSNGAVCDSAYYTLNLIVEHCEPDNPEPEVIPDPIYPETPEPEWTGTIRLACEEENVMRVEVSVEQELSLYEVRDHSATTPRPVLTLVEQWTQAPGDAVHVLTLEAEHTYMLKGQDATIRIRR